MRVVHRDALICDFAQYYHVYDIDAVDVQTAAILACGLPSDSRTIREMSGSKHDPERIYKYALIDAVRSVEWAIIQAHSGKKKVKRPESMLQKYLGLDKDQKQEVQGFDSPEEYEAARARIIEGVE